MQIRFGRLAKVGLAMAVLAARAGAAPYDSFTGSTRSWDAKAPEGRKATDGEWGVSEQLGAATYTHGIAVPPGRNGMQPVLALRYSSQSPRRGGLADGWTLDVPTIRLEAGERGGSDRYSTTLGEGGTLVPVDDLPVSDPAAEMYRLQFEDSSFARFEYVQDVDGAGEWRVYTQDGVRRYFNSLANDSRWFLNSEVDPYGNTIEYVWKTEAIGLEDDTPSAEEAYTAYLSRIEYTSNGELGLAAHARVLFTYGPPVRCGGQLTLPIGGALEAFGGVLYIAGALPLESILTDVRDAPTGAWRPVRTTTLIYNGSCGEVASPVRELGAIHESAVSPDGMFVDQPPVTFTYGPQERSYSVEQSPPSAAYLYRGIRQKGTTTTLLDMDGDGIDDLATSAQAASGPGQPVKCKLQWRKGLYGGGYETTEHVFNLPTATWRLHGLSPGPGESCTLTGQVTHHWNRFMGLGGCPNKGALIGYHFMDTDGDGLTDLLVNIWSPYFYTPTLDSDFIAGAAATDSCQDEGLEFIGTTTTTDADGSEHTLIQCSCPGGETLYTVNGHAFCCNNGFDVSIGDCASEDDPGGTGGGGGEPPGGGGGSAGGNAHCEDLMDRQPEGPEYLWRVYKNTGANFASEPEYWFSPVPLPPNTVESIYPTQMPWAMLPNLVDLDGDGSLDVIDLDGPMDIQQLGEIDWTMYRGRPDGNFADHSVARGWSVPTFTPEGGSSGWVPDTLAEAADPTGMTALYLRRINSDLVDVNGDHLPDLVVQDNLDHQLVAYLNTGNGFRDERILLGPITGLESTLTRQTSPGPGDTVGTGDRWHARRLMDVDEDGLADLVDLETSSVRFNHGSGFLEPRDGGPALAKAVRNLHMDAGDWKLTADLMDVTGDGVTDVALWSSDGALTVWTDDVATAPRLLRQVDNGRGMTVSFEYRPSTDPETVTWSSTDARLPQVRWVVRTMTTTASATAAASTTTYHYRDPVYGTETGRDGDRQRFLGFRQVTTDLPAPSGALAGGRAVRTYDYDLLSWMIDLPSDRRGHVAAEAAYNRNATTGALELASFQRTNWNVDSLFDGSTVFTHHRSTLSRVCSPEIPDCTDFTTNVDVVREEDTWEPWSTPDGAIALYYNVETIRSARWTGPEAVGDRDSYRSYEVRYASTYDGDDYRTLPIFEQISELTASGGGTSWSPIGRTETRYDGAGLPVETDAWMDDSTVATTLRTFDGAGNLISVVKPEQIYAPAPPLSPKTEIAYDAFKIYPTTATNELGHTVNTGFDVGTGAQLFRAGPNHAKRTSACGTLCPCNQGPTCTVEVPELEQWSIDGFGRVIDHRISVDHPTFGYTQQVVDRFTYSDLAIPNQATEQHLKDYGGSEWVTTTREFDGAGRVTKETQPLAILPDAESRFEYDAAGNLATAFVPDPRVDTGAMVSFIMSHDALGRTSHFTRPDGANVKVSYKGLETTVVEQTTDGSGDTTRRRTDVFGRLVEVAEGVGAINAVTHYAYDAQDNLNEVTDADGNVTSLTQDWLGHRTSIRRGTRTWTYGYDRNGNLVSETSPAPAGRSADYTTSYSYDDLDRIVAKAPAVRDLGDTQRQRLGIGPTLYTYDLETVPNSIGRISRVELYPRTTSLPPWGTVTYEYQARGLVSKEERTFGLNYLASMPPTTQRVNRVYNALGEVTLSTWNDVGEKWRTVFDERGLPHSVEWNVPGTSIWRSVATYSRSVAGGPRSRSSDPTFSGQVRTFAYDAIGRVAGDVVSAIPGGSVTLPVIRNYMYTQSGDLGRVTGSNLGTSVDATFTYDALHRLVSAAGPGPYNGAFTYSKSGNILTAQVSLTGSAEVPARNVTYHYGAVDPQAVDSLTSPGGATWASFEYDPSGNTIQRQVPDGTYDLTWDGEDQVREVEGPGGSEVYYYDHTGQRVLAVSGSGIRWWFDEAEIDLGSTGVIGRRYLHLSDNGGTLARVEIPTSGAPIIELQYADTLHNLVLSLNTAGTAVANFVYTPFGEVLGSAGASTHRRQFNGKEHDATSGLAYYGARYFDPVSLRWNSGDPLYRFAPDASLPRPQEQNIYTFSGNNALRNYDASGLGFVDGEPPQSPERRKKASEDEAHYWQNVPHNCDATCQKEWKYVFGGTAIVLGLVGLGLAAPLALEAAPSVLPTIAANPETVTLGTSVAIGLVDPHPPGASPLDLPGPGDDAGRAAKEVFTKAEGSSMGDFAQWMKELASEQQVDELVTHGGEIIVKAGEVRDAPRLIATYGGTVDDWAKIGSSHYFSRLEHAFGFETHAYKNVSTGQIVEMKSKVDHLDP